MPLPHPCPDGRAGAAAGGDDADVDPTDANTDSTRRDPSWPSGQAMGSEASAMGRRASKVWAQVGQRYS
jgi:hypothetical protein